MTTQHPRLAHILAAGTVLMLSAGCSVAVTTGPSTSPPASVEPAGPTSAAPSNPPSTGEPVPAGGIAVDTLVVRATRSADRTSATVKGDTAGTRYDNALSLWAGCDGSTDEVLFGVAGHKIFQGELGLRSSVPDDIVVHVLILADGDPVQNIQLDGTNPTPALVPIRFLIEGKKTVTTQTKVARGNCASSDDSYAVLVDGYVS
ncbi:MAG: hypothetical protein QM695_01620 [Micropruina sp.]